MLYMIGGETWRDWTDGLIIKAGGWKKSKHTRRFCTTQTAADVFFSKIGGTGGKKTTGRAETKERIAAHSRSLVGNDRT